GYFSKTHVPPKIFCQTGRDSSKRKSSSHTKPKMLEGCLGWYCLNSANFTLSASLMRRVTRQTGGRVDPMPLSLPAQTLSNFVRARILPETSNGDFGTQSCPFWCP